MNTSQKEKRIYCGIISIVAIIFFSNIWYDIFTVNDALVHYVWAKTGNYIDSSWAVAVGQGRIMYFIYNILSLVPYAMDNILVYNICSFITIIFCTWSLFLFVKRVFSCELAYLATLLFLALAQADGSHNFFVAYILVLQGAIGFCLLSLERFAKYYEEEKNRYLVQSAILFVIASSAYESLIFYSLLIFAFGIFEMIKRHEKFWSLLYKLRFHIVFEGIYLAIYLGFRMLYPSQYDANQVGQVGFADILNTAVTYSFGLFPGTHFWRIKEHISIEKYMSFKIVLKACLVGIGFWLCTSKRIILRVKENITLLFIMAFGIFLPCIIYGFTERHVSWVKGGTTSYGASYYSYFFIIIVFTLLLILICQSFNYKKVVCVVGCLVVMLLSAATDLSNKYFSEIFKHNYYRYMAFNEMLESEPFSEIEDNAIIYVEGSNGIHGSFDYVNELAHYYTGKMYRFVTEKDQIDFDEIVYEIKYMDDAWCLAEIDDSGLCDSAYFYIMDNVEEFSVLGYTQEEQEIYLNGEFEGCFEGTFILPMDVIDRTYYKVEAVNMRYNMFQIAKEILEKNETVSFETAEGFYSREIDSWWGESEAKLICKSSKPTLLNVRMILASSTDSANMQIFVNNQKLEYCLVPSGVEVSFMLEVKNGQEEIRFSCDGNPLVSEEDPRNKVFRMIGLHFDTAE